VHKELLYQGQWREQAGDSLGNPVCGGNTPITLLPLAARTAAIATPGQSTPGCRGVTVVVNVTAASGTGGLTAQYQVQDPVSGSWKTLWAATAALTAPGLAMYLLYPGAASGAGISYTQVVSVPLSFNWRVNIAVGDASSYTYSVSAYPML